MPIHSAEEALAKFLGTLATEEGVANHIYIVGGAIRNLVLNKKIKDIDLVVDTIALHGYTSDDFASAILRKVNATKATNQYGVSIVTISDDLFVDGFSLKGQTIEIANARKETYGSVEGKGYKPEVVPATIQEDIKRREFVFNTLLIALRDAATGLDKKYIQDLLGTGKRDIRDRMARTPMDPNIVFSQDPTRLLRLVKFAIKYDFSFPDEIRESCISQAHCIHNPPPHAIAIIFIRDILKSEDPMRGLRILDVIGVLPELLKLFAKSPDEERFLSGESEHFSIPLILHLYDIGFRFKSRVSMLSPKERQMLKDLIPKVSPKFLNFFVDTIRKPPIDNMYLIEKFKIRPHDRSAIKSFAVSALFKFPELCYDPRKLQTIVEKDLNTLFNHK